MKTLAEIRQDYPEYNDMSDKKLSDAFYRKFYSDMDRSEFDSLFLSGAEKGEAPRQTLGLFVPPSYRDGTSDAEAALAGARPQTEEAEALDLLALNALTLGLPTKAASALGFKAPQEAVSRARELTGGYGAAAEAVGSLPSSLLIGGKTLGGMALRGAGYGGAAGLGLSEEGDELSGALLGATIGAAAPAVIAGIPAGYSALRSRGASLFKSPEQKAEETILQAMEASGINLKDVAPRIKTQSPLTFAEAVAPEATEEGIETVVKSATQMAGRGRQNVISRLKKREETRIDRITARLAALPEEDVGETVASLGAKRSDVSAPLYDSALNFNPTGMSARRAFMSVEDPTTGKKLSDIVKKPSLEKAISRAKVALGDEGFTVPKKATFISSSKKNEIPQVMRLLDYAKRELDDEIESALKSGARAEARRLQKTKDELVGALDEANPIYKNARASFEEYSSLISAAESGATILTGKGMSPKQIFSFLKTATPAQKENFRIGVASAVKNEIQNNKISSVNKILQKPFIDSLESAWPDSTSFNAFKRTLQDEVRMARGTRALRTPAPKIPEESTGLIDRVVSAATTPAVAGRMGAGSRRGAAFVFAGNLVRNVLGAGKMSAEEADEISRLLMASTPKERKATLDTLVARQKITQSQAGQIERGLNPASIVVPLAISGGLLQ